MTAHYVLAVDAGNSKTMAVVADDNAEILGVGRAGCGDIYSESGEEAAIQSVLAAVSTALGGAGIEASALESAAFHLAGVDWPEDEQLWRGVLETEYPGLRTVIRNDGFALLRCVDPRGRGAAVTVGTGPAVAARGYDGAAAIMGFWCQHAIGGAGLGDAALKAVALAELDMAPKTSLREALLERYVENSVEDLLHRFTRRGVHRGYGALAGSARLVMAHANAGDTISIEIVSQQAATLVNYVAATAQSVGLHLRGDSWPIVLGGPITNSEYSLFRNSLVEGFRKVAPVAEVTTTSVPPVLGTLIDAFAELGDDFAGKLQPKILETRTLHDLTTT